MATFVLVHGGGHGGWCYRPVAERLRALGHNVYAPTLTGLADRAHLLTRETSLDTHIEDIARFLRYEDLRDVVLAGHSYGGIVVTGAADREAERIRRLVYLDAAIACDGESVVDTSPGLAKFSDVRDVDGIRMGLLPENMAGPLYGLTGLECEAWAMERLTPHPWATFEQPLQLHDPDRVAALPRAIINCTKTLERRGPDERARWLDGDYVREIDTAHDLMLSAPEAVTRMLCEIAQLD